MHSQLWASFDRGIGGDDTSRAFAVFVACNLFMCKSGERHVRSLRTVKAKLSRPRRLHMPEGDYKYQIIGVKIAVLVKIS
jgi:hypothetical protein